ncbi:MAG: 3-isopropylmalate dehydratase large subunit [Candidatus Micrarchaeota archaeon]
MSERTLFDKVWNIHAVKELPNGQTQLFVGINYLHEVTTSHAFTSMRERNWKLAFPQRNFATIDHVNPTDCCTRPFKDKLAEALVRALEKNAKDFGITIFGLKNKNNGIIHVIGPELGITQPGMVITCGDSHTSTHGAFGSLAFGIGTSQVFDVLATQCVAMKKLKVRKIELRGLRERELNGKLGGKLAKGVYAKDIALTIIRKLGVNGGIDYAYEYCGEVVSNMNMEERMTLCNMSIEGGAAIGYVNPDEKTFAYLKGKKYAPKGNEFKRAIKYWKSIRSDSDAKYDDVVTIDCSEIEPTVTWGINPSQCIGISENIPDVRNAKDAKDAKDALEYMGFRPGTKIKGTKINVAFIGSCTNGRISDLREAAHILKNKKIANGIRALAVPGSYRVKIQAEKEGLDKIFISAGFEWRNQGCSMCLAINPDRLKGKQICASSSNRNFKGRQGSQNGRTILMSPAMVAAAAIKGKISDVREEK